MSEKTDFEEYAPNTVPLTDLTTFLEDGREARLPTDKPSLADFKLSNGVENTYEEVINAYVRGIFKTKPLEEIDEKFRDEVAARRANRREP